MMLELVVYVFTETHIKTMMGSGPMTAGCVV